VQIDASGEVSDRSKIASVSSAAEKREKVDWIFVKGGALFSRSDLFATG
jgi:hypothetical protein